MAWDDGRVVDADVILWATGFRPAVEHLAPLKLREPGGGIRAEDTRAVRDGRVHLVGYGPSASTIGANRAGRAAVRSVMRLLKGTDGQSGDERPGPEAGSGRADRDAGAAVGVGIERA